MSIDSLFLEDSLSYLLDESNYSILLESSTEETATSSIFTYGFGSGSYSSDVITYGFNIPTDVGSNTGYLTQLVNTYYLFTEDGQNIVIGEGEEYPLLVEFDDYLTDRRVKLLVKGVGELGELANEFTITMPSMRCISNGRFDENPYGYVRPNIGSNLPVLTSVIYSNIENMGTVNTNLGNTSGEYILGLVNENMGFKNRANRLSNLTLQSTGILTTPNYAYLYAYVY